MGIGNSGVEHAQFYRAACFDRKNIPYKYIFMELVKNLHEAMAAWKIPDNKSHLHVGIFCPEKVTI